jgi:hypothetical protein
MEWLETLDRSRNSVTCLCFGGNPTSLNRK